MSTYKDLQQDAWLEKLYQTHAGYHKGGCGGPAYERRSGGRMPSLQDPGEPVEVVIVCGDCGLELGDEDICQDQYEAETGLSTADLAKLKPEQEPIEKCTCGGVRWSVTEWLEQECGGEVQRVRRETTGCTLCRWPEEGANE